MALDPVANFVRGSTDASVDNTTTTISVVDASIFPDPSVQGEYNVVLWAADSFPRPDQDPSVEVVRVTARDTGADALTVTRGQEGTTAAAHPSGSALQLSPTAKMFSDIATKTSGLSDDGNSLSIESASIGASLSSARQDDQTDDTVWHDILTASASSAGSVTVGMTESSKGVAGGYASLWRGYWSADGGPVYQTTVTQEVTGGTGISVRWNGGTLQWQPDNSSANEITAQADALQNDVTWHI